MNNKDKSKNMKMILTSIVTVVIAILVLTTTNQAETIQSEAPIPDAQNNCFQALGSFESKILPECPSSICTQGKLIGSLWGDYEFKGDQLFPTGYTSIPNVFFYTGLSTVHTLNGDIHLTDAGALELSNGRLSSLLTVTSGNGDYARATGYLHVFGASQSRLVNGKFEGTICK